jgi:hypothetical protein
MWSQVTRNFRMSCLEEYRTEAKLCSTRRVLCILLHFLTNYRCEVFRAFGCVEIICSFSALT